MERRRDEELRKEREEERKRDERRWEAERKDRQDMRRFLSLAERWEEDRREERQERRKAEEEKKNTKAVKSKVGNTIPRTALEYWKRRYRANKINCANIVY